MNFLVDWKAGFAVMVNGRLRSQAISAKTRGCARQRVVTIGKWTAVNALGGGLQRSKSAIEIGLEVFDILHADMEPLPSVSSGQAFAFAEIVPNMKSEWPPIYLVAARACVYRYQDVMPQRQPDRENTAGRWVGVGSVNNKIQKSAVNPLTRQASRSVIGTI